ncbi:MAG: hypothetical protein ABI619_12610 [Betaproteobacteria bacterium]
MTDSKRAWQSAIHQAPSVSLPQPSNQNVSEPTDLPWELVRASDPMPFMFEVTWSMGRSTSYAYSDLRIVDSISPSELWLNLYSMEKIRISITGRNLAELAGLLSRGRVLRIIQTEPGNWFDLAEESPAIETICVESFAQ